MGKRISIIGGGAAGCFCAVETARRCKDAVITVFEAADRPMAKLAVTGGGRCNITNTFEHIKSLKEAYPRGYRLMQRLFNIFGPEATAKWWESNGIKLVVQEDGCVFPKSQNAMEIVGFLKREMEALGVTVLTGKRCCRISGGNPFSVEFTDGTSTEADMVVFTIGGTDAPSLRRILPQDIETIDTVPSLFTFKINDAALRNLTGIVVENATAALAGTSFKAKGPLLITDWGVSGPAILKLSSYAARSLSEGDYKASLVVNWLSDDEENVRNTVITLLRTNPHKNISSVHPVSISGRLWEYMLEKSCLKPDAKCVETSSKGLNRLINTLTADCLEINGRCKFKSEFVTCGGVSLKNVDPSSLECRKHSGLYFGGEALDIDAVTGGFNLQAAWTCGYTIARNL